MNQQPLEVFGSQALFGCGFKLLHRGYAGALAQVLRHDDDAEVLVYPDVDGKVSLNSPLEVISGTSEATILGGFLCVGNYTFDPAFVVPAAGVTAGVITIFDQSANVNNLTNTDKATQPLIIDEGELFFTFWGLGAYLGGGRYLNANTFGESVSLHYRLQLDSVTGTKYLFRQTDNLLYAKVTDLYLDEAVGVDDAVVFINEGYFRDYTTYNIPLEAEQGLLITLDIDVSTDVLSSPPSYRIENVGTLHTLLAYSDSGSHVRRHSTNIMLSEDIADLKEKLERYNPNSYYNIVSGAKAAFGMFSFAGILGPRNTRILRAFRQYSLQVGYIDVFVDNTGYVTLDSPVANPSDGSLATVLGEWVGNTGYTDVDGVGPIDAYIDRLYSQISEDNFAQGGGFTRPKLYDGLNQELISAGFNGVVGMEFYVPGDDTPEKSLTLNTPIYAKTVVVVYANDNANAEMSCLVSAGFGSEIYSKFYFPQGGQGLKGATLYDATTFNYTEAGLDTAVHVVALYDDAQKFVVDTEAYDVTYDSIPNGIEGTELEGLARWQYIGSSSGNGVYYHKGRICAVLFYDDDKYVQRDYIHSYFNTLFGIQNQPLVDISAIAPPDSTLLLDGYPNAALALSASRRLSSAYTGSAIRVRRSSDNAELNIGFNSLGLLNEAALTVFCYGANGFITTWYDQSGNGNDLVQATTSAQPKIYDGTEGYLTGLQFVPASNTHLGLDYTFDMTDVSAVLVAKADNTGNYAIIDAHETTAAREFVMGVNNGTVASTIIYDGNQTNDSDTLLNYDDLFLLTMFADSSTANDSYLNGQACTGTTSPPATPNTTNNIRIGQRGTGSADFSGLIFEFVVWFSDQSTNRAGIEANINGHYGIYADGLIDRHPGTAVAYSLRLLSDDYTGDAIRVRRSTDNAELNIGFIGGELDTQTLTTFCGSANGFVSVWYDQSSNGNDATQATTASQPKVYDSATGVVLENGKVAVDFDNTDDSMTASFTSASNYSVFHVLTQTQIVATSNLHSLIDYGTSGSKSGLQVRGSQYFVRGDTTDFGSQDLNQNLIEITHNSGQFDFYKNTSNTRSVAATLFAADGVSINRLIGAPRYVGAKWQEIILYPSDQSANRLAIETDVNDFYQMYWSGAESRLLDSHPNAAAAFSLRALNSNYTGPLVRVRRASDNAEQDVFATYDGELNVNALATFCAGTNGFVVRWYDQSSNGNNATQTTTSLQPKIYDSVTGVELEDLTPALLGSTSCFMLLASSIIGAGDYAVFTVHTYSSIDMLFGGTTPTIGIWYNGGLYQRFDNNTNVALTASYANGDKILSYQNRTTGTWSIGADGGAASTGTNTASWTIDRLFAGFGSTTYSFAGKFQEFIAYESDQSANRAAIEDNINGHYGIYDQSPTGLLATYPGAAAAYSLRQLISTARLAIAVRRDSDDAVLGIGFVNGQLDTATLASFCSGTDGYVSVWFDQSGNGNDLTQGTAAKQPKVYDSVTGVDLTNAKPSAYYDGVDDNVAKLFSLSQPLTVICVYASSGTGYVWGQVNATSPHLHRSTNYLTSFENTGVSVVNGHQINTYIDGALGEFYVNGLGTAALSTASRTYEGIGWGSRKPAGTADGYLESHLQELIVWDSDQSANRAAIEANINAFYSIY